MEPRAQRFSGVQPSPRSGTAPPPDARTRPRTESAAVSTPVRGTLLREIHGACGVGAWRVERYRKRPAGGPWTTSPKSVTDPSDLVTARMTASKRSDPSAPGSPGCSWPALSWRPNSMLGAIGGPSHTSEIRIVHSLGAVSVAIDAVSYAPATTAPCTTHRRRRAALRRSPPHAGRLPAWIGPSAARCCYGAPDRIRTCGRQNHPHRDGKPQAPRAPAAICRTPSGRGYE